MLVTPESSSALLVMICSKSMSICNHSRARLVDSSRNRTFSRGCPNLMRLYRGLLEPRGSSLTPLKSTFTAEHFICKLSWSKTFAVSIVGSKLDYCSCVLYGISQTNLDKLQRVQNVLARVTAQAPWSVSATDLRRDLHWLPIRQRFIYKLSVLTYKALHTGQPCYLADLIDSYEPFRCLRSTKCAPSCCSFLC